MRVGRSIMALFIAVLFMGSGLIGGPALASNITLNAVSMADIPPGAPIYVEIFDDSASNVALKKSIEEALVRRGYTVQDDAPLIMAVETRDTSGRWTGGGENRLIQFGNSDDHTGTDAPDVRLNIFDSQRGGLLNPKRGSDTVQVAPSEFRIDATLTNRSDGKTLWQGWTVAPIGSSDDPNLQTRMVDPLVSNIGRTVRTERLNQR